MNANGWDVLSYAMLALLIGVLLWFVIARWIDERRQKREDRINRAEAVLGWDSSVHKKVERHAEFIRRYREHR